MNHLPYDAGLIVLDLQCSAHSSNVRNSPNLELRARIDFT